MYMNTNYTICKIKIKYKMTLFAKHIKVYLKRILKILINVLDQYNLIYSLVSISLNIRKMREVYNIYTYIHFVLL